MKKKIVLIFVIAIIFLTGCSSKEESRLSVVTTNFPCYDFARAVIGDNDIELSMLLKPGSESHSYEPTPQDIIKIKKSDVFIYVGGESDEWISDILNDLDKNKTTVIKLIDIVDAKEEEIKEGMESLEESEEKELDEHVWTSPINAIKIVREIENKIIATDKDNQSSYKENADKYVRELENIDQEIRKLVSISKRKVLIFGDRFPLRYFTDEYGLDYYAAFPGCAEQTEANAKTISFLINKVKEEEVPAILKIELSSGKIANTIAKETKTKVKTFNAVHNLSVDDFEKGKTYIDFMKENIEVLREVLN